MRKHDKFTYSYGWRTAPEQWHFGWNGSQIRLDNNIRNEVACLMLSGKETEAEAVLKRLLRKQEKSDSICTIGFRRKNDNSQFYYTKQLIAKQDDLQDKLRVYKEWKRYCLSKNCCMETHTVTRGVLMANGKMSKGVEEDSSSMVDIHKPVLIKLVYEDKRLFDF